MGLTSAHCVCVHCAGVCVHAGVRVRAGVGVHAGVGVCMRAYVLCIGVVKVKCTSQ